MWLWVQVLGSSVDMRGLVVNVRREYFSKEIERAAFKILLHSLCSFFVNISNRF